MTQATKELLADINKETKLNQLKAFNEMIAFINDSFRIWSVIENKHSSCITLKGILKGKRAPKTYVLNMNGALLLNGKKEVSRMDNNNTVNKYVFIELLN